MRLLDLSPQWVRSGQLFIFECPHCVSGGAPQPLWLSVKNVVMTVHEQFELFAAHNKANLDLDGFTVAPCRKGFCWTINGSAFESMSVTPSLDASAAGHWHGFITNGEIT